MTIERIVDDFDEVERYELRENPKYYFSANRREFVQVLGAGLAVAVSTDALQAQQSGRRGGPRGPRREEKLSERFHVGENGVVTVLTSKVEVGQGSRTQIAQAAAEELHLRIDQVQVVMADTQLCPDDGGTAGSRTTPSTVPRVRNASAALFDQLAALAAKRLGVDLTQVKSDAGVFAGAGKQITLAELAKDKDFESQLNTPAPQEVPLTPRDQWKLLGTSVPKVDGISVVTGAAQYPSDIILPKMLFGKVLRPPSFNATLRSIDLAPAQAMAGVVVVRDGNFIGCAAPTSWQAAKAVEALRATAEWDQPAQPSSDHLFEYLKDHVNPANGRRQARGAAAQDSAPANAKNADRKIDVAYTVAYIQHAPMEPRAAVAEWNGDRLIVRTGTQQPSRVQSELSQTFRIPSEKVRVIVPDTGGGFGGKHTGEVAVEAARLAKGASAPVSLRWTRDEEFAWAYFRPAGLIEVKSALDSLGRIDAWEFVNYNSGGSALETPYRVKNPRQEYLSTDSPLRQGSYRALASTGNTFARESAMDELAALAGVDPLEFRLQHLESGRLKDVLVAAAEKFQWASRRKKQDEGHGIGLACGTEKGSFVAACAQVNVVGDNIRVISVCEAYECGAIQNPSNLRAQVEGAIVMGLGGALTEAIEFKDGKITNASFSTYRVPRLDDVPELDIVLLDRPELPSVGAGETPIIAVAPAIANAVYHAVGKRSRSMPLRLGN